MQLLPLLASQNACHVSSLFDACALILRCHTQVGGRSREPLTQHAAAARLPGLSFGSHPAELFTSCRHRHAVPHILLHSPESVSSSSKLLQFLCDTVVPAALAWKSRPQAHYFLSAMMASSPHGSQNDPLRREIGSAPFLPNLPADILAALTPIFSQPSAGGLAMLCVSDSTSEGVSSH